MPAHIKSSLLSNNLTIPITNGALGLEVAGIFVNIEIFREKE